MLTGYVTTGTVVSSDHINATVGFGEFSRAFDKSIKGLMRMVRSESKPLSEQSICGDPSPKRTGEYKSGS